MSQGMQTDQKLKNTGNRFSPRTSKRRSVSPANILALGQLEPFQTSDLQTLR